MLFIKKNQWWMILGRDFRYSDALGISMLKSQRLFLWVLAFVLAVGHFTIWLGNISSTIEEV